MKNWLDVSYGDIRFLDYKKPVSNSGERYKDMKQLIDHDGIMELEVIGKHDLFEEIQSHKDSVDIHKMLERYQNGDTTALDRVTAQYLDLENAPKTLAEMYSFVRNTSAYFDTLPLEIRKEYDFNVSKFVADLGSDRFQDLFSLKETDIKDSGAVEKVVDKISEKVEELE